MFRSLATAGLVCALLAGCASFEGESVPRYRNAVFADRWYSAPDPATGRVADIDYFLMPRDDNGYVTLVEVLRRTERDTGRVQWTTGACRGAGQVFRRLLNFQYEMTAAREAGGTLAQELQEEFRAHFDKTLAPCWRDEAPF